MHLVIFFVKVSKKWYEL